MGSLTQQVYAQKGEKVSWQKFCKKKSDGILTDVLFGSFAELSACVTL
jgi:hypothetical protein